MSENRSIKRIPQVIEKTEMQKEKEEKVDDSESNEDNKIPTPQI